MKTIIILSMLLTGSAFASYVSLPKVTASINNSTEISNSDLQITLITYRVKRNMPPFGIGHGAPELITDRKRVVSVDKNGSFTLPKLGFWDGKRRYIGLKIESNNEESITMHNRMPEDEIYFSEWVPLMMKLSDWSYIISEDEYVNYYSAIELYYNIDGKIIANSSAPFNALDAYEGNTDYLQRVE